MNDLIEEILKTIDYRTNPYFTSLADGSFTKEDFIETQIQFFNAVTFFSRPMAALAAKIPTPELRVEVVRNVWEEHGEGNPSLVHGHTFLELLNRLGGISPEEVEARYLWPEVRIFNTALVGACVLDEFTIGTGLMGVIERMFSDISNIIGKGIVERGWLTQDQMIHYSLHEELDIKHSQDFFDILEKQWKNSEERYFIEQGIWMGATLFNDLYTGLYQGRERRWKRDVTGPHTRAAGQVSHS